MMSQSLRDSIREELDAVLETRIARSGKIDQILEVIERMLTDITVAHAPNARLSMEEITYGDWTIGVDGFGSASWIDFGPQAAEFE